jgi:hypothetical protein
MSLNMLESDLDIPCFYIGESLASKKVAREVAIPKKKRNKRNSRIIAGATLARSRGLRKGVSNFVSRL